MRIRAPLFIALVLLSVAPNKVAAASVSVIDVIPASASYEHWQNSEPNIAVNPRDPKMFAISALTENFSSPDADYGPIFISTDAGSTWIAVALLPGGSWTNDVSLRFSPDTGYLYAAIIRKDDFTMDVLRTADPLSGKDMDLVFSKPCGAPNMCEDQPYVETTARKNPQNGSAADGVFVSSNDRGSLPRSAALDVSLEGNLSKPEDFSRASLERRDADPQDGPSVRTAVTRNGRVYEAFFSWQQPTQLENSIWTYRTDVRVDRDGTFGKGKNPFGELTDPSDQLPGVAVAKNVNIVFTDNGVLGGERVGSALSIAVDPRDDNRVYVAWADGSWDSAAHQLSSWVVHVRRSTDGGRDWSGDLTQIPWGTNPSLAITEDGTVGLLTQRLQSGSWLTELRTSKTGTFNDDLGAYTLSNAAPPTQQADWQPLLGDYDDLRTSGNSFIGVFSATNIPSVSHFPSGVRYQRYVDCASGKLYSDPHHTFEVQPAIDPFFFKVDPTGVSAAPSCS